MSRAGLVWRVGLGLLAAMLAAGGLHWWNQGRDETWARIERTGSIRIGYTNEPPYSFPGHDGEAMGESPEVARAVVKRMGIGRIEWRLADFGMMLDLLETGEIDVVAAGMFITPERERRVAFTPATAEVGPGLLVQAGNPRNLHSYHDLVRDGTVWVAAMAGSAELEMLRALGVSDARLLVVADARSGWSAVATGQTHVLALSRPTVCWLAAQDPEGRTEAVLGFTDDSLAPGGGGRSRIAYAMRKTDLVLLARWSRAEIEFLGTPEAAALAGRYGFERVAGGGSPP